MSLPPCNATRLGAVGASSSSVGRVTRGQCSPVWCGKRGYGGLGFLGMGQSTQRQSSSPMSPPGFRQYIPSWTTRCGTAASGGRRVWLCQVPPFTVVGAQTPLQLLQSLPFPFCFWFFWVLWVLRDGSAPSWRAGSQSLSLSFCLSPTYLLLSSSTLPGGRAGSGGSHPADVQGGRVRWGLPQATRVPWCCLVEREGGCGPGSWRSC